MRYIFLIFCALLFAIWVIVWAGLHLVGGAIHLLLVLAVLFLVMHFFHRRRAV